MNLDPFDLPLRARRELGFDEVVAFLHDRCRTVFGQREIAAAPFPRDEETVRERMLVSMEARRLAERSVHPDFGGVRDLSPQVSLVEKEGILGAMELIDIARTLDALGRIKDLIASRADELPLISKIANAIHDERSLSRRISKTFDENGNIHDDASPALLELRERVRNLRVEAKVVLEGLIREMDDLGLLRERNFTLRHDRYVLPVKSEHQGLVEGIVQDSSQTGQTVFVEPRDVMKIGNRIMIGEGAVREEERRILTALSLAFKDLAPDIVNDLTHLGRLEAAFVRGLFVSLIDGKIPTLLSVSDACHMRLDDARHPLLALREGIRKSEEQRGAPVVANNIRFDGRRALIVSGPNAGGKTIALKTVGLTAILVRAGLPVSVGSSSQVPLFSSVLATIGDEQSISDDLSSFSGHLEMLARILESARVTKGKTLVVLDEICAGTDPNQGAALAQAVLESLVDDEAQVVATTHYERLKVLAVTSTGQEKFRNASFSLNIQDGRPTFRLHLDSVGTSNAFDAAKRHGIDDDIIARATTLLDPTAREVQSLLDELAQKNATLDARLRELDDSRAALEAQNAKLRTRLDVVHEESNRLRREGARAFLDEMRDARKLVADAIETVQKGADARTLNDISHALRDQETRAVGLAAEHGPVDDDDVNVEVGAHVEVQGMPGVRFVVVSVNGDDVELTAGAMRTKKKRSDVRRRFAAGAKEKIAAKSSLTLASAPGTDLRTKENSLDLRGARVEDALERMDAFFDTRMRDGHHRVFVLHGHGTGALKRAIRDAMKSNRYVQSSRAGDSDEGGDAITVVELRDRAAS